MNRHCASSELVRAYPRSERDAADRVIRANRSSRALGRRLQALATQREPVLILGETGTGKTLLARTLHEARAEGALITLNCASLGDSQLAQVVCEPLARSGACAGASGTTLFMDEIGELSPWAQAVLLRALIDGPPGAGARIVAATHRDLEAMVRAGSFSGELLLRLRGAVLHVLPLRERRDEIAPLTLHFLRAALASSDSPLISFEPGVLPHLERHNWPGNVRELQNTITRALTQCSPGGCLGVEALPEELRPSEARA